jgi:hypothetical protein
METSTPGKFDPQLGDVASRRRSWKPRRVFVVHVCEVRRVGQEYPNLDDVFERCARRMQDRLTVGERLTCLFLNRRADEGSGRHINAD